MPKELLCTPRRPLSFIPNWSVCAWLSVAVAGLCSLPPALLRGPFFERMLDVKRIFALSLAAHVNASLLFWLAAVTGAVANEALKRNAKTPLKDDTARLLFLTGFVLTECSVLAPNAVALKNNYVSVVEHPIFYIGFGCLCLSLLTLGFAALRRARDFVNAGNAAICALFATLMAALAVPLFIGAAATGMEAHMQGYAFAEHMSWYGGHVIVGSYSALIAALWLMLTSSPDARLRAQQNPLSFGCILVAVCISYAISAFIVGLNGMLTDDRSAMTLHMIWTGGVLPAIAGLGVLITLYRARTARLPALRSMLQDPGKMGLVASIFMFAYGGLLGAIISGENTSVPAHYHGSVVAVTFAAMGFFFNIHGSQKDLPASASLLAYAFGQTLHITGLWQMGGYGALRKTAASPEAAKHVGAILFFTGGGIAMMGAIAFAFVFFLRIIKKERKQNVSM